MFLFIPAGVLDAVHRLETLLLPLGRHDPDYEVDHVRGEDEAEAGEQELDGGVRHLHVLVVHEAALHVARPQRVQRVVAGGH